MSESAKDVRAEGGTSRAANGNDGAGKSSPKSETRPVPYQLEARTQIWTGDVNMNSDRLIATGLLGSIRWWFEVLVRGLGGYACDPTQSRCINDKHCVVCELFGCAGWGRKFRFDVLDAKGEIQQRQLKAGAHFQLRFTPLRAIAAEEWALLDLTIRLIADCGAIGGKTVLKPSKQNSKAQHADYGLVSVTAPRRASHDREQLTRFIVQRQQLSARGGKAPWASCAHMWFVSGRRLTRVDEQISTFNRVIGRPEPKGSSMGGHSWLMGSEGVSKKVFSFENPPRTFGFVERTSDFDGIREKLSGIWTLPLPGDWFSFGDMIVNELFRVEGRSS